MQLRSFSLVKWLFVTAMVFNNVTGYAQKQTFDVVSYTMPKGWQQQQNEGGIQLSASDKKTGGYAIAIITKAVASTASPSENFNNDWTRLVKSTVQVNGEPAMQAPEKENGWDIVSGSAGYIDGANKGTATLITATSGGQSVSVVMVTNTQQYQNELLAFINSLELPKVTEKTNATIPATNNTNSSIVGLWVRYNVESNGYSNGFPVVTGGYFRREYFFYADGTYLFRVKDWGVFMADILFVYETGTWKVNGNQLTLTPRQGRGEWWGKAASGKTNEWGSRKKASDYKLETVTYNFDFHYYSGSKETVLVLSTNKATQRDATGKAEQNNKWEYSPRAFDKSLIDNPPGVTTGFENKKLAAAAPATPANATTGNTGNATLAGKIWEGSTAEKFTTGTMNGYSTGGFFKWQYRFNADGTYKFAYVGASAYIDPNILQYETGTYSITGNQLTITPATGTNEEWSVVGGPVKLSGMSDVQIRNIKEHWGKKIKTEKRKLEPVTYTFRTAYQQGNKANALIVEYTGGHTEREGNGNTAYYFDTPAEKAMQLPAGVKL
ncbi:lipocalin-like domain-containing protein [Ferruginibacter sp.]